MNIQSLDWTDIKKHKLYYARHGMESPLYCSASDSAHNAIGRLCRQIGNLMNADYSSSTGTGVSSYALLNSLCDVGLSVSGYYNYNAGDSETPIENGHILLQIGSAVDPQNNVVGHAWLLDGFMKTEVINPLLVGYDGTPYFEHYSYNHINWGWDGKCNGFFLDNVFDTTRPYSSDPTPYNTTASWNFYDVFYLELFTL